MVDLDPHGIEIYLQYLKHVPCHLLGMSFHDIDCFNESSHQRMPITPVDSHKIKSMLRRRGMPQDIRIELMRLNTGGFKAELEIMCEAREPQFFTRTFLAAKLKQGLQQVSGASQASTRISQ
jgi:DNA topoisomerase VI subunit A